MEAFKPPDYITRLIDAINDGARTAQNGALAFLLVGLYLVATAFSTTDEDLLRESTTSIAQIGVQVPAVVAFAIAPVVFVALHAFMLIRYDMLAVNLRQFQADLEAMVPFKADRERCRQLLANVEFVQALAAPRGSALRSRMYRFVSWTVVVAVPLLVISVVVISALRFQSLWVTRVQKGALAADVLLLIWFYWRRLRRAEPGVWRQISGLTWPVVARIWPAPLLLAFAFLYANVPGPEDMTVARGRGARIAQENSPEVPAVPAPKPAKLTRAPIRRPNAWNVAEKRILIVLSDAWKQPLDLITCPRLWWGCRYLTVDHRTLVVHVWNNSAVANLRAEGGDLKKSLAMIEGLFLGRRPLLFADLSESRLYDADLREADLRGALLPSGALQGANLTAAQIQGTDLEGAQMQGAVLAGAQMQGANLTGAQMQGADLEGAQMQGANLTGAQMQGANFYGAKMQGANLSYAEMQGADLRLAQMQGANLFRAQIQGAELGDADLRGADLSDTRLWHVTFSGAKPGDETHAGYADITLADMTGADVATPLDARERGDTLWALNAIPDTNQSKEVRQRVEKALAVDGTTPLLFTASPGSVLVGKVNDPHLVGIDRTFFTAGAVNGAPYDSALAALLADEIGRLAPSAAGGIALRRALPILPTQRAKEIGCRLLADAGARGLSFEGYQRDLDELKKRYPECPA